MKNQVSAPRASRAFAALLPSAQVSFTHCTVVGEQALPVRSEVAALEARATRFRSRMHAAYAERDRRVGQVDDRGHPVQSTQRRAMAVPISGLF